MITRDDPALVFFGRSNQPLFEKILSKEFFLNVNMRKGEAKLTNFSDGELFFSVEESVRGLDCYIVQSTCHPHNDNLIELCVMADALKRASAKSVTAIFPYFGYARQDRQVSPRTPITAKLVADIVTTSGVDHVVVLDIHSWQTQGFFNTKLFDNLQSTAFMCDYLYLKYPDWFPEKCVIVSPDVGGVKRARNFAKKLLDTSLAIVDKRRPAPNQSEVMHIIGDVQNKNCILVDDMADTAGTLCQAAKALRDQGANEIIACVTHPVLSGAAISNIENSVMTKLIVSDTIPLSTEGELSSKIEIVSCADLIRSAIERIHNCGSISEISY